MQRPIKFRAKSVHGEWWYGSLNPSSEHRQVNLATFFANLYAKGAAFLPETLGEYTGRKDVDGMGIYEGDRFLGGITGAAGYYMEKLFVVEFFEGVFGGVDIEDEDNRTPLRNFSKIGVIGNIHENPLEPTEKGE